MTKMIEGFLYVGILQVLNLVLYNLSISPVLENTEYDPHSLNSTFHQ
jgi:hypothetical protein